MCSAPGRAISPTRWRRRSSRDNMPAAVYRTLVDRDQRRAADPASIPAAAQARCWASSGPLRYYDNYPPIFALQPLPRFSVADSERITLEALQPLGEDYLKLLRRGFAGRWMNVYPHPGKASGAYMDGAAYDVHPYLLLNHTDDYQSLSTIAHEWGHAVHTLLAHDAQPFEKASYSTFIAESASIGNEMLLIDYMVDACRHRRREKLYYLGVAPGSDPQYLFPPGAVRRVRAAHPRGAGTGPCAVGRAHERDVLRPAAQVLRRGARGHEDRSGVLHRVGLHPALLPEFLCVPVRDLDGGRGRT